MMTRTLSSMAWRNIWRNRRRTLITLSSIAIGVLLAVLFTGIGDASYSDMIDFAARLGGGHVTLQHAEQQETPSLKRPLRGATPLLKQAQSDPSVRHAVVRVSGEAMLATSKNSQGVGFIAIDPKAEDVSTLSVMEGLVEGRMFEAADGSGMVLGEKLASNLGVKLGRKVVYTMTDKNGEIVSGLARVSGIVRTGGPTVDSSLCLLPIERVRKTLGYAPDEATKVAIFLHDQRDAGAVAARMSGLVAQHSNGEAGHSEVGHSEAGHGVALAWYETMPDLAGFINMKVSSTVFMELVIMLLVAAGIFNTLFMSVMERLRELGVLLAIGFSPGQLFRLVMWESFFVGLMGLLSAALLTAVPYYLLHTKGIDMSQAIKGGNAEVAGVALKPILYVSIYPTNAALIAGFALVATLLAGLYPAWRAARVEPVDAIKLV